MSKSKSSKGENKVTPKSERRKTRAYHEGRTAFIEGDSSDCNPYKSTYAAGDASIFRTDWFNGWYDEWRWSRWGKNIDEEIVC